MKHSFMKIAAYAAALSVILSMNGLSGALSLTGTDKSTVITASAAETGSRIRVDINRNDGRKASNVKNANNWILEDGSAPTYKVNGVTFKLSNGKSHAWSK